MDLGGGEVLGLSELKQEKVSVHRHKGGQLKGRNGPEKVQRVKRTAGWSPAEPYILRTSRGGRSCRGTEKKGRKPPKPGLGRWLVPPGSAWKREGKERESVQALTKSVAQREGNPA